MLRAMQISFAILFICVLYAWAAPVQREPDVGYVYPAGGQQGTVVHIAAGGQHLWKAKRVYVSGEGVTAKVIKHYRPLIGLDPEDRQLLRQRLEEVRDMRLEELGIDPPRPRKRNKSTAPKPENATVEKKTEAKTAAKKTEPKMPEHPLLEDLEEKSLRDLVHLRQVLFGDRQKRQQNRQLAEQLLIEVTIAPDAKPGSRELRFETPLGLTDPVIFQVGQSPEVRELEPNDQAADSDLSPMMPMLRQKPLPKIKPIELPVVLNGQILPGDVDRFRFHARQGQKIVIETQARSLIPYLADAVPGWFQAVISLYDEKGEEVAFSDDFRFHPDPVLCFNIPGTGDYEIEIRDSIYRGREDFVYRISMGEQPFITSVFPLGSQAGKKTVAHVQGWNLPVKTLALPVADRQAGILKTTWHKEGQYSNPITYSVDELPQCIAVEPDNTLATAQAITLPAVIHGCIEESGDVDVFGFQAKAQEKVVTEIYGRRLNSPIDSLLRITDAEGKVLAWNDDLSVKDSTHLHRDVTGLVTHHADSYVTAELPKAGTYFVHVSETQQRGGSAFAYRLRVSAPQPDFELRVTPSSVATQNGMAVPICVYALRKDGFEGAINVSLNNAPSGFALQGATIPAGCDRIRMTLKAPAKAPPRAVALQFEGKATIDGKVVAHTAVPADDVMQAFLYRHLVPAQELLVSVRKTRWRAPEFTLAESGPVKIVAGDSSRVRVKAPQHLAQRKVHLELVDAPKGIALENVTFGKAGITFRLRTDSDAIKDRLVDNVIVNVLTEWKPKNAKGKGGGQPQEVSIGYLPAIPIEVVSKSSTDTLANL